MIRTARVRSGTQARPISLFWLGLLLVLALFSLYLAWSYSGAFGDGAAIVLGGIGAIALMLLVLLWGVRRSAGGQATKLEAGDLHELMVLHAERPSIVFHDGQPVKANTAYFDLAADFGVANRSDIPPSIDRIFADVDRDTASTLFRLFHLDEQGDVEEAIITVKRQERIAHFRIRVSAFKAGQIWEITDLAEDSRHQASRLSNAPIGLFTANAEGEVLSVNANLESWVGAPSGQFPQHIREFIDNPEILIDSPKDAGRQVRADTRLVTHRGIITPVVLLAAWHDAGQGDLVVNVALHGHSSLGLSRGSSNDRPANLESTSTELVESMDMDFAGAPIGSISLDSCDLSEARIVRANAAFAKMCGSADWSNVLLSDMFAPSELGRDFLSMAATDCSPDTPFDAVLKGSKLAVSTYIVGDPIDNTAQIYVVDVTARKALEDQLVQSQKMQAIGRLVAEIAHDFNNLLAAMRLYTDTLLGRHPIGDPSYPELQQINSNINRAASLVKKLLAYSRKQTIRAVRLDVSETLSDMIVTLKQVLGERVTLDIVHGRNLPKIRVDRSQLDTVLMNLAVNARDAMKEQGGGQITIESRTLKKAEVSDPGLKAALESIITDRFVVISVADTGTGITDEIKSKIFEPFFTTKPQGEGTGLGLSTVYGIVQQSGGHLAIDSKLGVGTTFSIYFPEAIKGADDEDDVAVNKNASTRPSRPPADLAGQGNILFVEDEDSVRVIAAKTLRKRGYQVIEACDGEEAYDILHDTDTPFDLMISDVVMPGMDGPTLLKKARDKIGDARIVFISGYAEEEFSDLLSEEPDVTFLPKPFTLVQLAEKVKAEIGEVST